MPQTKNPANWRGSLWRINRSVGHRRTWLDRLVVVGNGHFNATVHGAARNAAVVGNRVFLAIALGHDARDIHTLVSQCALYRGGAALGQALVVRVGTGAVGVAF